MLVERKSNIELLRIVSMSLIALNHLAFYGGGINSEIPLNKTISIFMNCGGKFGVALFVMISAYFFNGKVKSTHIVSIWLQTVFVSLFSRIIGFIMSNEFSVYKAFFPIIFNAYWYVTVWIGVLLLLPFIFRGLETLSVKDEKKLIIMMSVLFVLFPSLLSGRDLYNNELTWFIYIVILIDYIKKQSLFINKYLCLSLGAVLYTLMGMIYAISDMRLSWVRDSGSIILLLSALFIFMFFVQINVRKSNFINLLGKSTFMMYLVHDNAITRGVLWNDILNMDIWSNNYWYLIISFLSIILLFIIAVGLQLIWSHFYSVMLNNRYFNRFLLYLDGFLRVGS